ncbi:TraX family protein [Mangrovibacter phragmitis]|uniref:TraX family protein n=1 Tax=Mangrovibacter phragmitis TaxID=1691903 RepID=UPI003511CCD8
MLKSLSLPPRPRTPVLSLAATLSPRELDVVKLVALLAMLVDHINTLFLSPSRPELYALGRMAFPLFTLMWAVNLNRPGRSLQARANRCWLWAVVTQPGFTLAFYGLVPWYALNILFVFAGVTQLLALTDRAGRRGTLAGLAIVVLLLWPLTPASYGLQGLGLALCAALYFHPARVRYRRWLTGGLCVSLLTLNGLSLLPLWPLATLVMAVLPTVMLPSCVLTAVSGHAPDGRRFMPRSFFWWAYAGHLLMLGLVRLAL